MTITPADRIYFVDPIQTPTAKLPENAKLLVTQLQRDRSYGANVGDIITVTRVTEGDYARFWYVGEDGNFYDGALFGGTRRRRGRIIDFIGDDAIMGINSGEITTNSYYLSDGRRWSKRRDFAGGHAITDYRASNTLIGAPWAETLWPMPNDSDELTEAKVALAKQKWTNRQHHAGILKEALSRDWLTTLDQEDFYAKTGMPKGDFGLFIKGTALLTTSTTILREALAAETVAQLDTMRSVVRGTPERFQTSIQVPIQFVHPHGSAITNTNELYNTEGEVLVQRAREVSDSYAIHNVITNDRYPILVSAPYEA